MTFLTFSCAKNDVTTVGIQPFDGFDESLTDTVATSIREVYGFRVVMLPALPLPNNAYVNIKSPRYRADTLIRYLKKVKPDSIDYILGLTSHDISTTKKGPDRKTKKPESKYSDWGIFGLAFSPGRSCIVSTFRLNNHNKALLITRLKKVSVHELGHNLGLRHCNSPNCVMRDAEETIKTVDKVNLTLCDDCKRKIKDKLQPEN